MPSLLGLFKCVTKEIYLYSAPMTIKNFEILWNNVSHVQRFVLCAIPIFYDDELNEQEYQIDIDPSLDFKIQDLSMFWSLYNEDGASEGSALFFSFNRFQKLIEALSYTSLVKSLKYFNYGGTWDGTTFAFDSVDHVLKQNGFNVTIYSELPNPKISRISME